MKKYIRPALTTIHLRPTARICTFGSDLNDEEAEFQGVRALDDFDDEDEAWGGW
ncbi:MAG: hypothetical protein HUK01_05445 [Bacteroidaceae bacterium]|nr:hypothetical protein [Bacteroidaceae bacterium]